MENIDKLVTAAFANIQESGKLEEIVADKVEGLVKNVIDSELRTYSAFGKKLTEHVKGSLNLNFDVLDFEAYNDVILKIIQRMLDGRLQDATTKRLEEDLALLLKSPPENLTLSKLITDFIEQEAEQASEDGYESISFNWDDDGMFAYASWDKEPGKARHQCAYMIGFHNGEAFSFRIDHHNPKERLFMGRMYAFDRTLFQMYTASVPITLDQENIDTSYPSRDYD